MQRICVDAEQVVQNARFVLIRKIDGKIFICLRDETVEQADKFMAPVARGDQQSE
jgi:uncharacterized protein (DUF1778 family)